MLMAIAMGKFLAGKDLFQEEILLRLWMFLLCSVLFTGNVIEIYSSFFKKDKQMYVPV